jgi:broad specificity phosphatase PhoE
MRVTFVRHGATEWTGRSVLCGQTDVPLSDLGRSQAAALASLMRGRRFDALWSSPLRRARDTAAAMGDAIGHAVVTDTRLQEMNLGQLEGASFGELPRGPGSFRDRWQRQPGTVRFPRGESVADVGKRTWQVLEELYHRHPSGHVLVVSHMFAISAMLCRVFSIRVGKFRTFAVDVASLTTVQMDAQGFRLLTLNDTGHLASLAGADELRAPVLPPLR